MNYFIRASVIATGLLPALLTPAPSRAAECRIGPVALEATACTIEQGSHPEGPAQYDEWIENGLTNTVIVITPEKPKSFRGYFTRWRYSHKCSVHEISFGHEVRFTGPDGAGRKARHRKQPGQGYASSPASSSSGRLASSGRWSNCT